MSNTRHNLFYIYSQFLILGVKYLPGSSTVTYNPLVTTKNALNSTFISAKRVDLSQHSTVSQRYPFPWKKFFRRSSSSSQSSPQYSKATQRALDWSSPWESVCVCQKAVVQGFLKRFSTKFCQ